MSHVEVVGAGGIGLRAVFRKVADRVGHVVEVVVDGRGIALLESVEGDASQDWPVSPPLQQVHFERRQGQGDVALLVGMAGRSHWSLSVEPDGAALVFDAACRTHGEPRNLGSRYRLLGEAWRRDGESASVATKEGNARIVVEPIAGMLSLVESSRELIVESSPFDASSPTVRWRYRIRIDGGLNSNFDAKHTSPKR